MDDKQNLSDEKPKQQHKPYDEYSTIMVAISIGVLSFIFICAFICLVVICKRQRKRQAAWNRLDNNNRSTTSTKSRKGKQKCSEPELALALNDIGLGNALEQILDDKQWVYDATGLIPHCLAVLRTCHSLTERLADFAMRPMSMKGSPERLVEAAKRIPFRVDDVVRSMYPPLDARLLEARVAALVLSIGQLALFAQSLCLIPDKQYIDWIDEGLSEMDKHLLVLRKASLEIDEQNRNFINLNSSQV